MSTLVCLVNLVLLQDVLLRSAAQLLPYPTIPSWLFLFHCTVCFRVFTLLSVCSSLQHVCGPTCWFVFSSLSCRLLPHLRLGNNQFRCRLYPLDLQLPSIMSLYCDLFFIFTNLFPLPPHLIIHETIRRISLLGLALHLRAAPALTHLLKRLSIQNAA